MIGSRLVMAVLGRPFLMASSTCFHWASRGPAMAEQVTTVTQADASHQTVRFIVCASSKQGQPTAAVEGLDAKTSLMLPTAVARPFGPTRTRCGLLWSPREARRPTRTALRAPSSIRWGICLAARGHPGRSGYRHPRRREYLRPFSASTCCGQDGRAPALNTYPTGEGRGENAPNQFAHCAPEPGNANGARRCTTSHVAATHRVALRSAGLRPAAHK